MEDSKYFQDIPSLKDEILQKSLNEYAFCMKELIEAVQTKKIEEATPLIERLQKFTEENELLNKKFNEFPEDAQKYAEYAQQLGEEFQKLIGELGGINN